MIHIAGRTEREGARFHHTPQNGAQHKIYELLSFGIFHLNIFRLRLRMGN